MSQVKILVILIWHGVVSFRLLNLVYELGSHLLGSHLLSSHLLGSQLGSRLSSHLGSILIVSVLVGILISHLISLRSLIKLNGLEFSCLLLRDVSIVGEWLLCLCQLLVLLDGFSKVIIVSF